MLRKYHVSPIAALALGLTLWSGCASSGSAPAAAAKIEVKEPVEAGYVEQAGHPALAKVLAVAAKVSVAEDEFAIFYYKDDGKYDSRAVWLWRYPDGDGQKNFDKTKDFKVTDGVGYMKFKLDGSNLGEKPILGTNGEFGFIIRGDDGWEGQSKDFIWNVKLKGNQVVYFDGAKEPDPVAPYKPQFKGAVASGAPNRLLVNFSGRFGLETAVGSSGFVVASADGERTIAVTDAQNADAPGSRERNFAQNVILTLAEDLPLAQSFTVNHPAFFSAEKIDTSQLVTLLADKSIPAEDYELGALYNRAAKSVEFRLWAPTASEVGVRLYDQSVTVNAKAAPLAALKLVKNESTGVWTAVYKDRDPNGFFYEYSVTTSKGSLIVLDPYAKSMDAYLGSGPARGAIVDLAASDPDGGWQGATDADLKKKTDAVIYEISVRDYTIGADSGVDDSLKGTYLGFIQKLDYLKKLGITHVQLLPVLNFLYNDETNRAYEDSGKTQGNNYNWGYDPHNWFTPEGWYSTKPADPYNRIKELKALIREIHKAGLGVILDVVYNHLGNISIYDDIVPNYFFRKGPDGNLMNNSGVGNDFNSSATMARRLVVDSLVHWVKEYNVDGFRFDLMGLIDAQTILKGHEKASALADKADILFEGEGWKNYGGPALPGGMMDQNYMTKTDHVAVFNDEVRNLLKAGGLQEKGQAYLTKKAVDLKQLFLNLTGQPQKNYSADAPADSMIYAAAHDNLDLHDAIAFNAKIAYKTTEGRKETAQRVKLANFLLLTGQGIVFLHGGQEKLRTKPNLKAVKQETIGEFVRNSYDSADNINQIVWTLDEAAQNSADFTRGLLEIRKALAVFRMDKLADILKAAEFLPQKDPFSFAYKLVYEGKTYFLLTNSETKPASFDLKADLAGARVLVDRDRAALSGIEAPAGVKPTGGSMVELDGLTAALLVK